MRLHRVLFNTFRQSYDFGGRDLKSWFPGHMAKGLRKMKANLKNVDCIIEVHDARISFSGPKSKQHILGSLHRQGVKNVIFTDCLKEKDENVKKIVPLATELIQSSPRYQRAENLEYCIMVIGVPNVGKSSLINAMRRLHLKKGKASKVGGEPGITRAVLSRIQVCDRPPVYLLDTPGVMSPKIGSLENGMKLAVCGTILDHLVGEDIIADYLLYTLNKHQQFGYVDHYELGEASDDIQTVLKKIAVKLGKTQKRTAITGVGNISITVPNYSAAAYDFIRAFRKGTLGKVMLD
ncbi:mitochondrial ribosome-associated GTPase 1 isoform X2 [Protopterus annectens]|uniref:mitochondrial ribosome-associated GTPase 1 isoform X2 n=1 Tax=Protopterus annectens TaxID=7888 RepID=UPI001CFBAEA5|nr:mitochondrial ribosome-associated GTPase 1 isoform X2 [Protopterus annectens]